VAGPARPPARLGDRPTQSTGVRKGSACEDHQRGQPLTTSCCYAVGTVAKMRLIADDRTSEEEQLNSSLSQPSSLPLNPASYLARTQAVHGANDGAAVQDERVVDQAVLVRRRHLDAVDAVRKLKLIRMGHTGSPCLLPVLGNIFTQRHIDRGARPTQRVSARCDTVVDP